MRKPVFYILSIGVAAALVSSMSLKLGSLANSHAADPEHVTVQRLEGQQQDAPPPPPPFSGTPPITQSPIERPRTFIGSDRAQVKSIEQALPQGSSVYVGPVGVDYETAAIAEADLDGDGVVDTIAVHTHPQVGAYQWALLQPSQQQQSTRCEVAPNPTQANPT